MLAPLLALFACPVTVPGDTAAVLPASPATDTAAALPSAELESALEGDF